MAGAQAKAAFKFDFGPGIFKVVESQIEPINRRYLNKVVGFICLVHLIVLSLNPSWFLTTPKIDLEESSAINIDFLPDALPQSPDEDALPNAQKSDETAVPANLLPQLPKKFSIESEQAPDSISPDPEEKTAGEDQKIKAKTNPDEKIQSVPDPNKVTKDDLLKRLAVERLKQENKIDQRMKAQKNALAKLKEELGTQDAKRNSGSSSGAIGSLRAKNYSDLLRSAVRRNLFLPRNFEYDQTKLVTQITVVIDARGGLMNVKLAKSSGNGAYDQAAIAALQNSVPLPLPPAEMAGQAITFNLTK